MPIAAEDESVLAFVTLTMTMSCSLGCKSDLCYAFGNAHHAHILHGAIALINQLQD